MHRTAVIQNFNKYATVNAIKSFFSVLDYVLCLKKKKFTITICDFLSCGVWWV